MWITRYVLPAAVLLSLLFAGLAPHARTAPATLTARELLSLTQAKSGANYTFSQATSARLAATTVARPADGASLDELLPALRAAGFELIPTGPPQRGLVLVQPAAP